jgi:hypothetical protein
MLKKHLQKIAPTVKIENSSLFGIFIALAAAIEFKEFFAASVFLGESFCYFFDIILLRNLFLVFEFLPASSKSLRKVYTLLLLLLLLLLLKPLV